MQSTPSVQELMPALDFSSQDLDANRAGTLGKDQILRLQALQSRSLKIGAAGFFIFAVISIAMLFFATGENSFFLTSLAIFVSFLNALFLGMLARQWMRLAADIRSGEVETLSGKLERVVRTGGRTDNFVLRMNGEDFFVKKEVFAFFRHEADYHFYRSRHSGVLLAAEPMNP
jgi:hypothetical protein